ncbi:MAG TPA: AAA family ATPase [Ottowia sp.]|uniref:bifunctional aminoglycoside phosphotransferase/ATP-binding protein n=1 Tax=Ottowia sp. TaxID=1898956 RepID=UPI002BCD3020|nr:AAA family ATPase [Ottowia sp.]HMN22500.1 AAA family ATPase [Ottowia sp.]
MSDAALSLVEALLARLSGADPACIETHASWVLLAGDEAWKIKKPVKLDFLDFSTLERRRAACEEELRINRRTAPQLYLGVVPITGTRQAPRLGGDGPAIEYAVHMRRFDRDAEGTRLAQRGLLTAAHIDTLARQVAALHEAAERALPDGPYGEPGAIARLAEDNFAPLETLLAGTDAAPGLAELRRWTRAETERLAPFMQARRVGGRVRECHGDLHLGNIVWLEGEAVLFDALEFDPQLRWIDTLADVAFVFMDLHQHGQPGLAWRFLNLYLDLTGDHAGLALLSYYAAYRALVRAKVAALRVQAAGDVHWQGVRRYLGLALDLSRPRALSLYIASGVSGSGKSSQSQPLIEQRGIVRLRADVERKRLYGLAPEQSSACVPGGIYTREASARTYGELLARARCVLEAGHAVLADATFLRRAHRAEFIALADALGVPCRILAFDAPEAVLRERVARRKVVGGDASEADVAVLEHQLAEREPFAADEQPLITRVDTSAPVDWASVLPECGSGNAA